MGEQVTIDESTRFHPYDTLEVLDGREAFAIIEGIVINEGRI